MYFKEILKNGNFYSNGFKSIFNLFSEVSQIGDMEEKLVLPAMSVLICFLKYSTLFGKKMRLKNFWNPVQDKNAFFIGALILKLMKVFSLNGKEVR